MKLVFVVDENVLIFALKVENAQGEVDLTALTALSDILTNCHSIAVDDELFNKYMQKCKALSKGNCKIVPNLISLLNIALWNQSKSIWFSNPPIVQSENDIHQDDPFIVRLAVATAAILVTDDNRLRESIERCGISARYNLKVVSSQQAIEYARSNCDP
jgi:hypothetical protein